MNKETASLSNVTSQMPPPTAGAHSLFHMQECISNCLNSFRFCHEAAAFIQHDDADNIGLVKILRSCAEVCQTSARLMMMESPFHSQHCKVCAEICQQCAEACTDYDYQIVKDCAQICRVCAESCARM